MNRLTTSLFLFAPLVFAAGETIHGTVTDPSKAPVSGAQVAVVSRLGVVSERATDRAGQFEIQVPETANAKLIVTAPGFETKTLGLGTSLTMDIELSLAPQNDSIRVTGSAIDVPASEQGSSVSVISRAELRERNEAQAMDLLRDLPGLVVSQVGSRGGQASLFIRGGDSKYNLVQIDGVTVNSFNYGGLFDFAHVPTEFLDRVEVVRGPQSAIYGSYANSGVVNFVTRSPEDGPLLDVIAEGGSHAEHRFAVSGGGLVKGFGVTASASRLDDNGAVANSDYRNENLLLTMGRHWGKQSFSADGNFNSNETGVPGPYGSDPAHLFSGLDRTSRDKNNFSDYLLHYQADLSSRVRQEVYGSFFLNNSSYLGSYSSFNKDLRGQAETRTIVSVSRNYTTAAGIEYSREEEKNTYITDNSFRQFPLRRDQEGIYWENRLQFGNRLFANLGARAEIFETPDIPAFASPYAPRPELKANTYFKLNPKLAVAYAPREGMRIHGSFGTGIRPPGGFDLSSTNNPVLKPETTIGYDAGIGQRFLNNRVSLDATYFYNRYSDLIVTLGGSLAHISSYRSDNLNNARAYGGEFTGEFRPARWMSVAGNYTFLESKILATTGTNGLAQKYYYVGQPLLRRPKHSGSVTSSFQYRKITANVVGYFRGATLDIEPNFGPSAGFFRNPGYRNIGFNLNYAAGHGVTVYGNLRNAFDRHYEEVYGYPSPILNFAAGIKWSLRGKGL
ncbi:MAG: TonB-dependent receptor [Bryobacteraceae bacterium]